MTTSRRPRSARTAAAGVVVAVVLVVGGALLYDVIEVRTGHPARRWRAKLAHQLAVRHLDDPWVLAGAGLAVALGLWLCWLAVTPGHRRWLQLRVPGTAIDRSGLARLIAERAERLPGVEAAAARVGRRRTVVTMYGTAEAARIQRELRAELTRLELPALYRLDVRSRGPAG